MGMRGPAMPMRIPLMMALDADKNGEISEIGRAHVELQSHHDLVCRLLLEKKKLVQLDIVIGQSNYQTGKSDAVYNHVLYRIDIRNIRLSPT